MIKTFSQFINETRTSFGEAEISLEEFESIFKKFLESRLYPSRRENYLIRDLNNQAFDYALNFVDNPSLKDRLSIIDAAELNPSDLDVLDAREKIIVINNFHLMDADLIKQVMQQILTNRKNNYFICFTNGDEDNSFMDSYGKILQDRFSRVYTLVD